MKSATAAECTKHGKKTNEMLLILPERDNEKLVDKDNFETVISFFKNMVMCMCCVCVCMCASSEYAFTGKASFIGKPSFLKDIQVCVSEKQSYLLLLPIPQVSLF